MHFDILPLSLFQATRIQPEEFFFGEETGLQRAQSRCLRNAPGALCSLNCPKKSNTGRKIIFKWTGSGTNLHLSGTKIKQVLAPTSYPEPIEECPLASAIAAKSCVGHFSHLQLTSQSVTVVSTQSLTRARLIQNKNLFFVPIAVRRQDRAKPFVGNVVRRS